MNSVVPTPRKTYGPFEVLATIGRGGQSTVYKVRHQPTGKFAALKVGLSSFELDLDTFERFKREFTVIRRLRHPNIVRALAFGQQDDVPYLVLEFVPGQSLEARVKQLGGLPPEECVAIFTQVAEGLRYLHDHDVLHRDIKPGNIFLGANNQVKLGDFGLLKHLSDETPLTRSRQGMGTLEYGAPEQFEDAKRTDQRCDLYSFAATLYTALTGKFPFGRGGHLHILQRKLLNQLVPLRFLLPTLDPALDRLVTRCLQVDPQQRPPSCDDVLAVLRNYRPVSATAAVDEPDEDVVKVGADRRATVRFDVDLTATFVPFDQHVRGRWDAQILDMSACGVRLQSTRPVAVNSVLHVMLGKNTRPQLAVVRWVKPGQGEMQLIGCSFVQSLTRPEFEVLNRSGQGKPIAKKC